MSNRLFRDGFVDSEAVNALTDWAHRVYSNLLVRHDNAGRTDGRLEALRSHLFPLGTTKRAEDFKKAVDEMEANQLVIRYEHAGKPYLQVTKVTRYGSAKVSKFPWTDGLHGIAYVWLDTRDGKREFVATSVGVDTPSVPPPEGVGVDSNINTGTGTGTGTNGAAAAASSGTKQTRRSPEGVFPALVRAYCEAWKSRYGDACNFGKDGGRNGKSIKELIERAADQAEAEGMIRAFLADGDPKLVKEFHPLPWLLVAFDKYRQRAKGGGRANGSVLKTQINGEV